MITGDSRLTAVNVSNQLVLISDEVASSELKRKSEILVDRYSMQPAIVNNNNNHNGEKRST